MFGLNRIGYDEGVPKPPIKGIASSGVQERIPSSL